MKYISSWPVIMMLLCWAKNTNTIRENTESLVQASRKVGLEIIKQKTKYMLVSHHQNAGQNHNLLTANISFKHVATFKYLGTVTNQICNCKETESKLNLGHAWYHSVQNFLSSCFLLKNNIKIHRANFTCFVWAWNLVSHTKGRI